VKQETIVVAENVIENLNESQSPEVNEPGDIPHKARLGGSKYKTIYTYQANISLKLPLGLAYWNVSIIPMSEILLAEGAIYIMSATLKSLHKVTLENRYNNKHIILDDITIINKLKELKLYLNPKLYKLMYTSLEGAGEEGRITVKNILRSIREDIKQLNYPVFKLKNNVEKESKQ